jgi:hypothetical protein
MNKQSRFQPGKRPSHRRGKVGYVTDALLRVLGLTDLDYGTWSSSRRVQNRAGETQTSLMPVRIAVRRRPR